MVFYLLQVLLPSGKQKVVSVNSSSQRKQTNFNTKDSQKAFIAVCATEAHYKEEYDRKVAEQSSMPPYITVIGSMMDPKAIITDFENVTYTFHSLAKAIDVCFKAYQLFHMEYPPAARLMWHFLNDYFYNFKYKITYPAVHILIKNIKGNIVFKNL